MSLDSLIADLEQALADTPLLDVRTHLRGSQLGARGLPDLLLDPRVVRALISAGCPLPPVSSQSLESLDTEGSFQILELALPYLSRISNTGTWWCVQTILRDLYDWHEPLTSGNWRRLHDLIHKSNLQPEWAGSVLERVRIRRACTDHFRRGLGEGDPYLQYALECGQFLSARQGEFDTALYELERTSGRSPESPRPWGESRRPPTYKVIRSLEDVHDAVDHYVRSIPYSEVICTVASFSSSMDYRLPSRSEMSQALARRESAGPSERDTYAAYVGEVFLTALESRGTDVIFQFQLDTETFRGECDGLVSPRTWTQLGELIRRHPYLKFQALPVSQPLNQALCNACREFPNLSLAGFGVDPCQPNVMRQLFAERLDAVPACKQAGFLSNAHTVEWAYAAAILTRKQMARVFAEKIQQGQYDRDHVDRISREILFDAPQSLLRMTPDKHSLRG